MKFAGAISLFFVSALAFAGTPDYGKPANFLCTTPLTGKSFVYADFFSESFIKAVPESYFLQITQGLIETTGKCETFTQVRASDSGARYNFASSRRDYSTLDLNIDEKGLITGVLVSGVSLPSVVIKNWDDIASYSKALGGELSVTMVAQDFFCPSSCVNESASPSWTRSDSVSLPPGRPGELS